MPNSSTAGAKKNHQNLLLRNIFEKNRKNGATKKKDTKDEEDASFETSLLVALGHKVDLDEKRHKDSKQTVEIDCKRKIMTDV